MTSRNIMLYFGSFSPIHSGHIELARFALAHTDADAIWLVLSPHNPMKEKDKLWNDDFRLLLARKATEKYSDIEVSDIEFLLPQPNYTYITLQQLRKLHPDKKFSILIGADNYAIFDRWRNYNEILANHTIWVYPREGTTPDLLQFPQMKWLDAPLFPVSSTIIREKIAQNETIAGLVPPDIEKIIKGKYAEYQPE